MCALAWRCRILDCPPLEAICAPARLGSHGVGALHMMPAVLQLDVACQAADALANFHLLPAVHLNIKPANLLRSATGVIKLADFGMAQMSQATLKNSTAGGMMGTLQYVAPGAR
jgi:serine/threonine protein kinase